MDVPKQSELYDWAKRNRVFEASDAAGEVAVWIFMFSLAMWSWKVSEERERWPFNTATFEGAMDTASPTVYAAIVLLFVVAIYHGRNLRSTGMRAFTTTVEQQVELATVKNPKKRKKT